jgi:hypothetical protein
MGSPIFSALTAHSPTPAMLSGMAPDPDIVTGESLDQLHAELVRPDFIQADHRVRPASADKRCAGCASCSCGRAAVDLGA